MNWSSSVVDKTTFKVGDVVCDSLNQRAIGFIKSLDSVAGVWYHVIEWFDGYTDTRQKFTDILLVSRADNDTAG